MKTIRIGTIGFGKVILAFLELISQKSQYLKSRYKVDIKIVATCDSTEYLLDYAGFDPEELMARKLAKNASGESIEGSFSSDIKFIVDSFAQTGVNTIIEALPPKKDSGEPALTYIVEFLRKKIPVVTVDKSPLVFGYPKIFKLSHKYQTPIKYSGATASALPTLDTASISLAATEIFGFEGILNGTTNLLLTEMHDNRSSLEEALSLAVDAKICEPDPSFDIDGYDTAFKTLILAQTLMDPYIELRDVDITGIRNLTYKDIEPVVKEGKKVKLLGKAGFDNERLRLRVTPSIITPQHPFYNVEGSTKAINFFSDTMGTLTLIGGASGSTEIAATILKDIINLTRNLNFY